MAHVTWLVLLAGCPDSTESKPRDTAETGDTAAFECLPLGEGFESALGEWEFDWRYEFGDHWRIYSRTPDGWAQLVITSDAELVVGSSYVLSEGPDMDVAVDHWDGAGGCNYGCDSECSSEGNNIYLGSSGTLELTVYHDSVDLRLYDVVLESWYGCELPDVTLALVEATAVPMVYCERPVDGL